MKRILFVLMAVSFLQGAAQAEVIHYSISKLAIKAKADLSLVGPVVYKGKNTLFILFKANGFNFFDQENIYVDPVTYKPLFVERDINIFGKKEKISEEYANGEVKITNVSNGETTQQVIKKANVDNIYGFIFYYRKNGSFVIGDTITMALPTMDISLKLVKQDKIQAAGKTYDSFYMQSTPSKYRLWFDASAQRLPLRISDGSGLGTTTMLMTGYEE